VASDLEYGIPSSKTSGRRSGSQARDSCIDRLLPTDCRTFLSESDLRSGQICPMVKSVSESVMDKRDRFIAEIRSEARAIGLSFRVDYRKGKGGHAVIYVGDKLTTLPSREIDPKTARKIRKHLGLAD
jgi:hypothetical protein